MRISTFALTGLLAGLAAAPTALAQGNRADLVVSAASEAPSRQDPGSSWPQSVTTLNQGRRAAKKSTLHAYLSTDQAFDAADKPLDGALSTPRLRGRRQTTQRFNVTVPQGTANGSYFVLLCADDDKKVSESDEGNNCRPSGQHLGVGASERGPVGAPGPQGPQGPPGTSAIGPDTDFRPIARTVIPLGDATVDLADFPAANGDRPDGTETPDEGSTSETTLVKYGPFEVVGSCKRVTNGDEEPPDTPPDDGTAEYQWDEDGDESKILVYVNDGTYSMYGRQGQRRDIPAGHGTPGADGIDGGEGKHMALSANHDPGEQTEDQGPDEMNQQSWVRVFKSSDVYIVHSSGTQLILRVWTGINIFGIGSDSCAYGGVLEVVQA